MYEHLLTFVEVTGGLAAQNCGGYIKRFSPGAVGDATVVVKDLPICWRSG